MLQPDKYWNLIHKVINDLHIPYSMREEAFSEALVAFSYAMQSFRPQKKTKASTWIYHNLRWSLINWMTKEFHYQESRCELSDDNVCPTVPNFLSVVELKEVVSNPILSDEERLIVFGSVWGMKMPELSAKLKMFGKQIAITKQSARSKLKQHTVCVA